MKRVYIFVLLAWVGLDFPAPPLHAQTTLTSTNNERNSTPPAQQNNLTIGVLAYRGEAALRVRWQPLADYLTSSLPGHTFKLLPVSLISAPELIKSRKIDYLVTNPGHFVDLADRFNLAALATRERRSAARKSGVGLMRYGAVIFTRANAKLQALTDLKGKELAAVSPQAFGGFQMAWREFTRQNMDPFSDLGKIRFMGFPQDAIVEAVLSGKVDVGTVRSGLLEAMALEGRLDLKSVHIMQADIQYDYPFLISSTLYPEWPFAALPGTDKAVNEQVLTALLITQNPAVTGKYNLHDGWSAPLSYVDARALISAYTNRARFIAPLPGATDAGGNGIALIVSGLLLTGLGGLLGYLLASGRLRQSLPILNIGDTAAPAGEDLQAPFKALTNREREVLCHICDGQSSKQIALALGISPKTVDYHRANLLQKTKAGTTPHLVQMATRLGLDQILSPGSTQ